MGVKTGVEKSYSHSASGKPLVGIQPEGGWQNVVRLLKNYVMRIDLRPGPTKQLDAVCTNLGQLVRYLRVRLQKRGDVRRQIAQDHSLIVYATAEVAGQVRFVESLNKVARKNCFRHRAGSLLHSVLISIV
jgi:hypothetical protein